VFNYGDVKGKVLRVKKSRILEMKVIGILGWYPTTMNKKEVLKRGRKKKIKKLEESED
jgi:hypothetical protein